MKKLLEGVDREEKVEKVRLAILKGKFENGTTKGKSKVVYITSDNNTIARRVKFDKFGVNQREIDRRTVYLEGICRNVGTEELFLYVES